MIDRLDIILVKKGLAQSRSQAAELIKENVVFWEGKVLKKPSQKIAIDSDIEVRKNNIFVGRGAHKLEGAFKDFQLDFKNKLVGDMGASTGGFTEFALQNGASKVYAVDVGHDQLAISLRNNEKVINLEGINIKDGLDLPELCDLIVVDLSFISLTLVLKNILSVLREDGELVCLVKPQFEVGRSGIEKNGLVRDKTLIKKSLLTIYKELSRLGCSVRGIEPCAIKGKTGNQEFFFYAVKGKLDKVVEEEDIQKMEI